ncbi:MAG: cbb3-type cytochrome c oxidase subunit I [Burkholderiaceae bacterium]|jgi:cytochrome c oxidase cbb3-type subunit 1
MESAVGLLLATFVLSFAALIIFVWSMAKGLFGHEQEVAREIFSAREEGQVEDPALSVAQQAKLQKAVGFEPTPPAEHQDSDLAERLRIDRSSAGPALVCLSLAIMWLVWGSLAGLISSIKLHEPDWWVAQGWITFGRIRPVHLNIVAYGWCSFAGVGIALWMIPRLLKTELIGARYAYWGALVWHAGVTFGVGAIFAGLSDGMEWLEIPWQIDILIFIGGALMGMPLVLTLLARKAHHLYVSVWYMAAGLLWFPILYAVANIPGIHFGVQQATMNWWFGHNALGLWFTPLGLAAAYYFIPKVLGKPIHSYNLSLLGFWGLAFFYSQVGGHHLIGGPVPSWFVTMSIVQSMMMCIPVLAVAINQHMTVLGSFRALKYSPTLRFIVLGTMMYTLASVQGSLESLRAVNTITHFTHYTVAHAHLGLYGFFSFVMFGSIYFVMPRITNWEWPYPKLISLHFWLVTVGMTLYVVLLSIGGWLQGELMLDAKHPFMDSVAVTLPYLQARSIGGSLMTLGHLVFAGHFIAMMLRFGPRRLGAAAFDEVGWMRGIVQQHIGHKGASS